MSFYPVILSGGAGSRLWPVSREYYPKPLLPIAGNNSLLQDTASRLACIGDAKKPLVVCNKEHRFLVDEQLNKDSDEKVQILLEPMGRDTAPALTVAALHLAETDPEGILVVMPADHVIPELAVFAETVRAAGELANQGRIVTFGVVPDRPETGYGYIKRGPNFDASSGFIVDEFVEKPNILKAEAYLASGEYFWNAGIFVTRIDTWIEEIGKHRPIILAACKAAIAESKFVGNFKSIREEAFLSCPSESIDYAVMENTQRAVVLPMEASWSDVGSWSSIWDISQRDVSGNVFKGDVISHQTQNSLVIGKNRCIATVGLNNVVVVETDDAILVADKSKSQDVKSIVKQLKSGEREEYMQHKEIHRPWGKYSGIKGGHCYQVKHLSINPGASISMQIHHRRSERWIVVSGRAEVTVGDELSAISENQTIFIPLGKMHKLHNPGEMPLEIIEIQTGDSLSEDDSVVISEVLENVS